MADPDIAFSKLGVRTSGIFLKYTWKGRNFFIYSPMTLKKISGNSRSINYNSSDMRFRYYADLPTFLYEEYKKLLGIDDESMDFLPVIFGNINEFYFTRSDSDTFTFFYLDPFLIYDEASGRYFVITLLDRDPTLKNQIAEEFAAYIRKIISTETLFIHPDFEPVPLVISPERIKLAAIFDKLKQLYRGRKFPLHLQFTFKNWIHPWKIFYEINRLLTPETAFMIANDGSYQIGFSWEKIEIDPPNPTSTIEAISEFRFREGYEIQITNKLGEAEEFKKKAEYILKAKKINDLTIHTFQSKKDIFIAMQLVKGAYRHPKRIDHLLQTLTVPFFSTVGEVGSMDQIKRYISHTEHIGKNKWNIVSLLGIKGKILHNSTQLTMNIERNQVSYYSSVLTEGWNFEETWQDLINQGRLFFHSLFGKKKLYGIFTTSGEQIRTKKDNL